MKQVAVYSDQFVSHDVVHDKEVPVIVLSSKSWKCTVYSIETCCFTLWTALYRNWRSQRWDGSMLLSNKIKTWFLFITSFSNVIAERQKCRFRNVILSRKFQFVWVLDLTPKFQIFSFFLLLVYLFKYSYLFFLGIPCIGYLTLKG